MVSPSHSEKTQEHAKDKDWLELGLGFSIACRKEEEEEEEEGEHQGNAVSASASSQLQQAKQNPSGCSAGLELGLSLGIDLESSRAGLELYNDDDDEHGDRAIDMAPPAGNYDQSSCHQNQDEDHYDDDDYDDMAWWPCDMNSGSFLGLDDWQMPVPNNSHHDSATTRRRPHAGLWFTLQSYTNRNGEALPQIPKAYIRVKDENVTVFMVKKYLVRKLGLSNEAEVDISCMGQKLLQTLTLKQVRDCVWLPRLVESVNPTPTILSFENYSHRSCVNDHLMSLQYGRRCALN